MNGQREVLVKLGKLYSKVDQQEKAIMLILDFLAKSADSIDFEVANVCSELLISKNRYKECCIFIEILALNPHGLETLMNVSHFYKRTHEDNDQANESATLDHTFKEYQSSPPGNISQEELTILKDDIPVEMLIKYCHSLMKLGSEPMKKTALNILDFAESLDCEEYLDVFIDIIDMYCDFGYLSKAIEICQKIFSSETLEDKSPILLRMGLLYGKMGDKSQQIEAYKKTLELNPLNKEARFRLSEIYENSGMFSDAIKILSKTKPAAKTNERYSTSSRSVGQEEGSIADEIYLSDDEENTLGKRATQKTSYKDELLNMIKQEERSAPVKQQGVKNQKVERLIKDIKNEETLNLKTRRRMVNIVELNEQFFVNIQNNIDEMMTKYNPDLLLLNFKHSELNLKSPSEAASTDFKIIKQALKLEQSKINLKESIYQLLLYESKGKIRRAFQGAPSETAGDFQKELNYLFIFKRKKHPDNEHSRIESIFKESKNKSRVAKKLSLKLVTKLRTVPDFIGMPRFVEILDAAIKCMYQLKKFKELSQICELLFKISKIFDSNTEFQANFYYYGFLANCRSSNFEKGYVFFRVISKNLVRDLNDPEAYDRNTVEVEESVFPNQPAKQPVTKQAGADSRSSVALRKALISKFESAYNQDELNRLCFCTLNHLFNEFSQQSTSQRTFFQKFKKQYENSPTIKQFVNMICCNNYIVTTSIKAARDCIHKNDDIDTNPLSNFLMGFINLVESTNRNTDDKIGTIHAAFEHFETYQDLSSSAKLPEVYYNFGRAFSHLNMPAPALKMFAKCKHEVDSRLQQTRLLLQAQADRMDKKLDDSKWLKYARDFKNRNLYHESSFNELVWQHKFGNKTIEYSMIKNMFEHN